MSPHNLNPPTILGVTWHGVRLSVAGNQFRLRHVVPDMTMPQSQLADGEPAHVR